MVFVCVYGVVQRYRCSTILYKLCVLQGVSGSHQKTPIVLWLVLCCLTSIFAGSLADLNSTARVSQY